MAISQNFPNTRPSLNLNFARSKTLDPRITFSRTNPTATYMDDNGLIVAAGADEPRFDHDPTTGESLGLLVEEQRTNLKIWSQNIELDFSRASITTITQNEIISPDGNQTADGIVPNSNNSAHYIDKVLTSTSGITASQKICSSVFFKKGVGKEGWFQIYEESGNALHDLRFDFETKELSYNVSNEFNTGGGVTDDYDVIEYPNGWYRLWIAGYPNTTTTGRRIRIRFTNETGESSFSGDGVSSYLYAWGVQVEVGSYPTSYIPTSGSEATRTADNVSMTGTNFSDWFNNNEFSIFTTHKFPSLPSNYYPRVFDINAGTEASRINHYHDPSIYGTKVGASIIENNAVQSTINTSAHDVGDVIRMASCFKNNDFALYVNGSLVGIDTSGVFTTTQRNTLNIGSDANKSSILNGTISQLTYYPTRLSNTVLQSLTK